VEAISLDDWWQSGAHKGVVLSGAERQIFSFQMGSGPHLTLLHGFPSSSHDWAKVAPALAGSHTVLAPDFLGFGASDKPREHEYSLGEQADLVESLWDQAGIESTAIVAHDYGDSVAQELLARRAEEALRVDVTAVTLLNGGIYPGLHHPEPSQLALLDPEKGPSISAAIDEALFSTAVAPTFAESFDATEDIAAIWRSTSREEGQRIMHLLIHYMPDRERHAERWTGVLEQTDVPLSFVWGMLDPVSGAHMAARIRESLPGAPLLALEGVGHWPQLEAPERVAGALLDSIR
jgi:pimeloyl-ACP methyl ester carboxylesterase